MFQGVPLPTIGVVGDCSSIECFFRYRQSRTSSDHFSRCRWAKSQMIALQSAEGAPAPVITPPGVGRALVPVIAPLGAGGAKIPVVTAAVRNLIQRVAVYAGWNTGALS